MGRRFGVLLCAPDQDYVNKMYGGYFSLFKGILSEAEEKWDLFKVLEGEFPAMEEVYKYDGFVVSGSRFDAHGNDVWILDLCRFLQTLHTMRIKVLGICFGHQILCRALGGKIGRAVIGWDIGLRKITVSKRLSTKHFGLEIPSIIRVLECHQDQVYKVPLGAEIIASSDKTSIEMFSFGDHILGVQGHPEYTSDILLNFIDNLLDKSCIQVKLSEEAKASLANSQPDKEIWEKICKSFLKS
ncbi:hypothetical protein SUGI_0227000 [Cryptomeria japonica]|uniref:gamma-glutamyl peptidase 5 n=1 Tax=Cryptomeria japonica TaxID=3369 RepID=UPI002408CACC|nr:gamma-glutamyl peptidase 5 [Cryptomeria japonica]GLJ14144.1 hypothetical protein SUGI_0227000 [Cryptomeria japonica]